MVEISQDRSLKVALETLGCKLNQAETETLSRQLADAGCKIVSHREKADIYILNTCTVTHVADRKSRHFIRMSRKNNPEAKIIITGCYAERSPDEISKIPGVDLVISNQEKPKLKQILEEAGFLNRVDQTLTSLPSNRTRSFIKIQDGCNNFCTYCIVPLVRGREKSLPQDEILREIDKRSKEDYQEIVLTGTEIGRYQSGAGDLKVLLSRVLDETRIPRIRLSSLQPREIDMDLISLWQNPRLCPHFHLSLQSGSDSILKKMNRQYLTADYQQAVELIRSNIPEVAITTDVIVGFPGETDLEFSESYEFCEKMAFSRMHVFPYSIREGTRAAVMSGQIEDLIKQTRSDKMLTLAEGSSTRFKQVFLDKTLMVLFEQKTAGLCSGITGNYLKVYTKYRAGLTNKLLQVKLTGIFKDGLWGESS